MAALADPDVVVAAARAWIGTPYILGGSLRGVGCDCVGLIRGVFADVTRQPLPPVPGWRADWAQASGRPLFKAAAAHLLPAPHDPRPGDVAAFRVAGREAHLGILVHKGRVIHADDRSGVVEMPLDRLTLRIGFRVAFPARF